VLKPLFRRYFNTTGHSSTSYGSRRRTAKNTHDGRLEAGLSFQDAFQVPVELGSVDHAKISGETNKPLPNIPLSDTEYVPKKDDSSEGSVFVIQQVEVDEPKPKRLGGIRCKNGERCQRLNDLWARKEPWSGV
jgi:hypothetical protein